MIPIFLSCQEELLQHARMACLSQEEYEALLSSGRSCSSSISLDNECAAWAAIAGACRKRLGQYPSTLEEDEALLEQIRQEEEALGGDEGGGLAGGGPSSEARARLQRAFLCILFRALKKLTLGNAIARLNYFAQTSRALGSVLECTVVEVVG